MLFVLVVVIQTIQRFWGKSIWGAWVQGGWGASCALFRGKAGQKGHKKPVLCPFSRKTDKKGHKKAQGVLPGLDYIILFDADTVKSVSTYAYCSKY